MSTDQPGESSKIIANAVTESKIRAGSFDVARIPEAAITAEKITSAELDAVRIAAATILPAKLPANGTDPADVPGHDEIRSILQAEGAPPRITLDIGGSDDLDGDGLVNVSLGDDGHELMFEDA